MGIRDEQIDRHKRIAAYRDILIALRKHRETVKSQPYSDPLATIYRDAKANLKTAREATRRVASTPRQIRQVSTNVALMGIIEEHYSSAIVHSSLGAEVKSTRENKYSKIVYRISVGHMWLEKVFLQFYKGATTDYGRFVILSAKPMRVNVKRVSLYEARLMDVKTGEISNGYVAKTTEVPKTEAFIRAKAIDAANAANNSVARQIDALLRGKEDDEDA